MKVTSSDYPSYLTPKRVSIFAGIASVPLIFIGFYVGTGHDDLPSELKPFDLNKNSLLDSDECQVVVSKAIDSNGDGRLDFREIAIGLELIDKATLPPVNGYRTVFHHGSAQAIYESRQNLSKALQSRLSSENRLASQH